jgi:hypothetical protein
MIARRGFIAGLAGLLAGPAIARRCGLMPVKAVKDLGQFARWREAINAIPYLEPNARLAEEMAFLEGMSQKIVAQFWYGNADLHPFELPGLSGFNEPTRLN